MENLVKSSAAAPLLPPSPQQYGGFMDLLGLQDLSPYYHHDSFLLDDDMLLPHHHQASSKMMMSPGIPPLAAVDSSSEAVNQPATPNTSSISSASSEAAATTDEVQVKVAEEEEEDEEGVKQGREDEEEEGSEEQKTKKKAVERNKKAKEKKQREPRFAFMTKSEVDHLEDGYRWRKYGQKAVKNSPFPRSYYRCTSASCNVKKRVERSHTDPSIVVTTYEGQHTHPSPLLMPRHSALVRPPLEYSAFSARAGTVFSMNPNDVIQIRNNFCGPSPYYTANDLSPVIRSGQSLQGSTTTAILGKRQFCPPGSSAAVGLVIGDHGLLEDVVPSHVLKEE